VGLVTPLAELFLGCPVGDSSSITEYTSKLYVATPGVRSKIASGSLPPRTECVVANGYRRMLPEECVHRNFGVYRHRLVQVTYLLSQKAPRRSALVRTSEIGRPRISLALWSQKPISDPLLTRWMSGLPLSPREVTGGLSAQSDLPGGYAQPPSLA